MMVMEEFVMVIAMGVVDDDGGGDVCKGTTHEFVHSANLPETGSINQVVFIQAEVLLSSDRQRSASFLHRGQPTTCERYH